MKMKSESEGQDRTAERQTTIRPTEHETYSLTHTYQDQMNEYDRMIMDGGKVCHVYHIISCHMKMRLLSYSYLFLGH